MRRWAWGLALGLCLGGLAQAQQPAPPQLTPQEQADHLTQKMRWLLISRDACEENLADVMRKAVQLERDLKQAREDLQRVQEESKQHESDAQIRN